MRYTRQSFCILRTEVTIQLTRPLSNLNPLPKYNPSRNSSPSTQPHPYLDRMITLTMNIIFPRHHHPYLNYHKTPFFIKPKAVSLTLTLTILTLTQIQSAHNHNHTPTSLAYSHTLTHTLTSQTKFYHNPYLTRKIFHLEKWIILFNLYQLIQYEQGLVYHLHQQ